MDEGLEKALLEAHSRQDLSALTTLYLRASDTSHDPDEAGFFLTQAYVFALDHGDERAAELRQQLVALGREEKYP